MLPKDGSGSSLSTCRKISKSVVAVYCGMNYIQDTLDMVQNSVLKELRISAGSGCRVRIAAQRRLASGAKHYNPCADSSPKMHKVHAARAQSAARALHQTSGRSPCAQSKAGATPRAMASGDRSGLWTFINARNVRFAREVLRSTQSRRRLASRDPHHALKALVCSFAALLSNKLSKGFC